MISHIYWEGCSSCKRERLVNEKLVDIKEVIMGEIKAIILMVLSQVGTGGVGLFYKFASADGMSARVIVTYRLLFATTLMFPLAFFLERRSRPKLTWTIAFQGFLSGLFGGALGNNLYAESLFLTSATCISAISNLMPATTFILAILFRSEKMEIGTSSGKAKVFGTVLGIGGAMILTFYKGYQITNHHHDVASSQPSVFTNPVLGSLYGVAACFSFSAWLVIQSKMGRNYPSYSSAALMCFTGSIQAFVFATCTERDWSAWKLGLNIRLYTVLYSGIVSSALVNVASSWCAWKKGPLFVSSFYPLSLIFVAFLSFILLHENLYFGSLIGSVLIIVGLYGVLWGKFKEVKVAAAKFAVADHESRSEDGTQPTTTTTTNTNSNNDYKTSSLKITTT